MLLRLGRVWMIVALCVSIGGHWAALQSIAWTTMLIDYAQRTSLTKAIEQTFDGQHPCDLCKRVIAGHHSEKKNDTATVKAKPDLICALQSLAIVPPSCDCEFPGVILADAISISSPPTPPPRVVSIS